MLDTSSTAPGKMPVTLEVANVATSIWTVGHPHRRPIGCAAQSLLVALLFEVALPANAACREKENCELDGNDSSGHPEESETFHQSFSYAARTGGCQKPFPSCDIEARNLKLNGVGPCTVQVL